MIFKKSQFKNTQATGQYQFKCRTFGDQTTFVNISTHEEDKDHISRGGGIHIKTQMKTVLHAIYRN